MPTPTEAQIRTQISEVIDLYQHLREYANSNVDNYLANEDTIINNTNTDFYTEKVNPIAVTRSSIDNAMEQAVDALTPLIQEYGRVLNFSVDDTQRIISEIYQHYIDTAQAVASRQFTFGTPAAAGGNVGDGLINRLTEDENSLDIENGHSESKLAEIIADASTGGVAHQEIFEFRGEKAEKDRLEIIGSGQTQNITALSAKTSLDIIFNPSFSTFSGTAAVPTSIQGWTPTTDIANFELDSTNFYRGFDGDTGPFALKIKANDKMTQKFSLRRPTFDRGVPIYLQIAYNSSLGSADGALTLRLGGVSAAVADLTVPSGWNILRIGPSSDNWFKNWNVDDPGIEIEWSGRTTGTLLVDDVVIAPWEFMDGSFYAPVGGQTKWLERDEFTWTDTEVGSIIQFWFFRTLGRYLPHAIGGGITFPDP